MQAKQCGGSHYCAISIYIQWCFGTQLYGILRTAKGFTTTEIDVNSWEYIIPTLLLLKSAESAKWSCDVVQTKQHFTKASLHLWELTCVTFLRSNYKLVRRCLFLVWTSQDLWHTDMSSSVVQLSQIDQVKWKKGRLSVVLAKQTSFW